MLVVIDGESLVGAGGLRSGDEESLSVPGERGWGEGEGEDPVSHVLAEDGAKDRSTGGDSTERSPDSVCILDRHLSLRNTGVDDDAGGGGWGFVGRR